MVEDKDREMWQGIEADYLSGEMTVRDIAKKHNVSESRIYKKATSDGWKKKKEKIRQKADDIVITRHARARAREMEVMCSASAGLARVLNRTIEQLEKTQESSAIEDLRGLSDLAKAIKSNTDALMLLHGIQTPAQVEAQRIARKRLKLEEDRMKRETEDADGNEIMLTITRRTKTEVKPDGDAEPDGETAEE